MRFPAASAFDALVPDERQTALSQKWLTPDIDNIIAGIARIRAGVDRQYEERKSDAAGEAAPHLAGRTDIRRYPYGYCEPIRDTVWHSLQHSVCQPGLGQGHFVALRRFLDEGGHWRCIWGELTHGPYLQNAIQIGTWYIDASNDTVVVTKPKLDVRPLADTNFRNVESLIQYFDVTSHYYDWDIYPNRVVPALAPVFPALAIHRSSGVLLLCDIPRPLFYRNLEDRGAQADAFLKASAYAEKELPPDARQALARAASAIDTHLSAAAPLAEDLSGWVASCEPGDATTRRAVALSRLHTRVNHIIRKASVSVRNSVQAPGGDAL
ncbi:MAG: hypothetical protein EP335_16530 [Alphaproteobacteria bacterium]|nr:MAG: hypothetical protein EP335_16530 [Alphaproteobacteria bacterium]